MAARVYALALSLLLHLSDGKTQKGTLVLGAVEAEDSWQYLTKFGYGLGVGEYDIRVRLNEPVDKLAELSFVNLQVEAFLDEDWGNVESLPACRRALDAPARASLALQMGLPGQWGPWHAGQVNHVMRSHIWYFAVSRCHGSAGDRPVEVEYELRMRQSDESELSVEMMLMPAVSGIALVFLTTFILAFIFRCSNFQHSTGSLHPVIYVLALAVILQWAAEAFNTLHFFVYRGNGAGLPVADGLAEVCFMLSQVLVSLLLVAISQGYTLRRSVPAPPCAGRQAAFILAVSQILLVAFNKVQGESSDKHHENDGALGWALPTARLALYACFVRGVQAMKVRGGLKLQSFLQQFQLSGSLYLLSHPVIFVLSQLFAPYLQHPIMELGMVLMQTTSAVWLTDLFLSRGAYFEASQLSSSLLPGVGSTNAIYTLSKDD